MAVIRKVSRKRQALHLSLDRKNGLLASRAGDTDLDKAMEVGKIVWERSNGEVRFHGVKRGHTLGTIGSIGTIGCQTEDRSSCSVGLSEDEAS